LEDRRNVGESSCNFGDGTDQGVQSLMFMMMMISYNYQHKLYSIPEELSVQLHCGRSPLLQYTKMYAFVIMSRSKKKKNVGARLTTKFHIWPKRHRHWALIFPFRCQEHVTTPILNIVYLVIWS